MPRSPEDGQQPTLPTTRRPTVDTPTRRRGHLTLHTAPDTIDLRETPAKPTDQPGRPGREGPELVPSRPLTVTVLVPTLNEERGLPPLLDDLAAQTYPATQILIIDGHSDDETRTIATARTDLPIEILDNPARRVPQALNIGLASSTGDVIVRVDGHARINSVYIETIAQHLSDDPLLGGVGGIKRAVAETETGRTIAKVLSSRFGVGGSRYHYADQAQTVDHIPFGAYPRALLDKVGGWDETFAVNQDYELDYRIRQTGRHILLDPAAQIDWHSRESIGRLAHQYHRYGQGKGLVVLRHPSSAKPRHLLPAAVVIGLGSSVVTAAIVRSVIPLFAVPAYAGLCGALAGAVEGVGRRQWPTATAAVAAMQVSYGAGLVRSFIGAALGRGPKVSGSQTSGLSRPGG